MLTVELERRAYALYGENWQTLLARRIRTNSNTVRDWTTGNKTVPEWVPKFLDLVEQDTLEK